jgi:hypothetical protein
MSLEEGKRRSDIFLPPSVSFCGRLREWPDTYARIYIPSFRENKSKSGSMNSDTEWKS